MTSAAGVRSTSRTDRLRKHFPGGQFGRYLCVGVFNTLFGYVTFAIALYLLNHKRAHLRALEERFRIIIMVNADENIGGQVSFLIEKGEQVHSPEQARVLAQQTGPRAQLARLRIEADRAWALVAETLTAVESGREDAQLLVLEVKAAAGEAAADAADLALKVGGGAAFRKESVVERLFRDSRAARVMAPTTDALHDFIGRAALQERGAAPRRRLTCLTIDGPAAVVMGKEPVYDGEDCVGYVTSAAYGYTIGRGIAYAWLPAELTKIGTEVRIGYFDERVSAVVAAEPLADPNMERIRA